VLQHPGIPLHTNGSENDIRACVTKRKISGGTMSTAGRTARDVLLGLMKTCSKLKVSSYRERKHPIIPRPIQVRHGSMRSQHRSLAARWAVFMPPATLPVVRDEGLAYEADFVEQPARGRIITPTQNPGYKAPCTQVIGPPDPELGRPFFG